MHFVSWLDYSNNNLENFIRDREKKSNLNLESALIFSFKKIIFIRVCIRVYQKNDLKQDLLQTSMIKKSYVVLETVDELMRLMEKMRENELDLDHLSKFSNINSFKIPILHPEIFEVKDFYEGGAKLNNRPSADSQINVEQLLSLDNTNRFQCLIGPAGVGKTTLSKRLVKLSNFKLSIHLRFSEINYKNKLTLQELLVNKKFVKLGFTLEKCQKVFSWILTNQPKCLLVLDGLDQAQFNLKDEPAHEDYNERLSVSSIIACLFKKTFLPRIRIIVTSRPHALLPLHYSIRPDTIYELQGLSHNDTATLLRYIAGDRYENISRKFTQLGSKLKDLCRCPLILQMFYLSQINPSRSNGEATTLTRVFATVLENFQHSKHNRANFEKVQDKLARLAYKTFINNQIMMTWEDVKREGLEENDIHDLIIVIPGYEGMSFKVLDLEKKLFFSHQIFHEYYCAWHIRKMSDDDFRKFCEQKKEDKNFDEVKNFLFGLIYDVNKNQGKLFIF